MSSAHDGDDRAVTLTDAGQHLLESHRLDPDDERDQAFYADVHRPRELTHDAELYRAFTDAEERLRAEGADVRRIVLDQDLKREYQEWLQAHNRDRPDSVPLAFTKPRRRGRRPTIPAGCPQRY